MDFHSVTEDVRICPDIRLWQDKTVQSQYSASPTILKLIENFRFAVSPSCDTSLFYQVIFDVDTAEGVGLDIWGRIVGVTRSVTVSAEDYLGFYGSLLKPFNQAQFWLNAAESDQYQLTDLAYRRLIMWKALANISTADAATLNKLLALLFQNSKPVYVLETGIMAIRLVIEFELEPYQRAILRTYGLFAKGAGVGLEWLEVPTPVLGFAGSGLAPFNQAPFFMGSLVFLDNSEVRLWR